MPDDGEARLRFWEAFWRELGFDGEAPTGSSRFIEVAVAQARAGSPHELIRALFNVLQAIQVPTSALAHFVKEIWVSARQHRESFREMLDSLRPLPPALTPAQATLVLQFVGDPSAYTQDERALLKRARSNPAWPGVSFEDAFGA
jgi:hypothetical protein